MSGHDDDALADDARSLLASFRAEEGLPADVRARVWARVDRSLQVEVASAAPSPSSRVRWAGLGLALAAAVAAIWWGRALVSRTPADAGSAAPYVHEGERMGGTSQGAEPLAVPPTQPQPPAEPPARAEPPAQPQPQPTTEPQPQLPAPPQPHARAPAEAPAPALARSPRATTRATIEIDGLADETELLRAAQSALGRGDARHALALLEAGTRRFGAGVLTEERAALHVLALCELGRHTRGRREADAFAVAHPHSPLLARVRSACADDSPAPP